MSKPFKRYLVTSALPYANGPVHIGHLAGVYIPSDIYTRYLRLKGYDVISVCGSDEHGVPITIKARKMQGVESNGMLCSGEELGLNDDLFPGSEVYGLLILPEVKDSDIASIAPVRDGKPVPTGVMVYGHMPLMVTRACPLQNIHDCAHCNKAGELTDRKAKKFPVRCGMGVRTIYNPVPIYMGDKPGALTVDYGVTYFTLESREEAAAILDSIRVHAPFEGEFTRGLYFKGTN